MLYLDLVSLHHLVTRLPKILGISHPQEQNCTRGNNKKNENGVSKRTSRDENHNCPARVIAESRYIFRQKFATGEKEITYENEIRSVLILQH